MLALSLIGFGLVAAYEAIKFNRLKAEELPRYMAIKAICDKKN
jgi:hypothetical protein